MSNIVHFEFEIAADAANADAIIHATLTQTAAFAGNEGIRLLTDDNNPSRILVEETWVDLAHYDAYLAWRATAEGANELGSILARPTSSRRFRTPATIS